MPIRILIIDDHEVVRNGLRSLLSSRPDWVICGEGADGVEAIEKCRALRPDILIMDVSMPRMDGIEATRVLREELPDTRVVIVSQNDPAVVSVQARDANASAYIAKSNLTRDLLPTLDKVLDSSRDEGTLSSETRSVAVPEWLTGSGEMGRLIIEHDWSTTPLGPMENWPLSLKTSINLMVNSQHPMWIGWGPEATFLYNAAYIQVLSLAKHPWALGRPAKEVWSEIWDVCGPLADKVFQKGEASFFDEVRLFMNRGDFLEETYYSFSYSPIRDESGKVGGLFCPSTEVTPKVISERRLRTLSELSTNALMQKTTQAACTSAMETLAKNPDDVPFAVLYLSEGQSGDAQLRQVGRTPQAVQDLLPLSADPSAGDGEHTPWPLAEVVNTGRLQAVSVKDVAGLPLGCAQQPLSQAILLPLISRGEKRSFGVLVAGVNPTRLLQADYLTFFELLVNEIAAAIQNARATEEERKRAEALAEIDRAKTAFFSNVSHEFRTPLTLMLGPLEDCLAAGNELPAEHRERLEVAHRNSTRLLRLVNTLLDFSRIEAGRTQASYEATDLAKLTIDLASGFRSATERAGLRLVINCPDIGEPVYVDREMWEKIVLNLLSNAFKFTFEGEIEVSLQRADGEVELSVRDTGTGIPEQDQPHLFERFYRVKEAQGRTFEGSGIGLSLVQELARLHGGTVRVQSARNQGSTFTVSLPLGKDHLPAERIGASRDRESTAVRSEAYVQEALRWLPGGETISESIPLEASLPAAGSIRPTQQFSGTRDRVLLVDDNADMRDYVQRLLSNQYEVVTAPDGESALESARQRRPDLILSDIMMPRLDGYGLLQAARAEPALKNVPVILLSARAGEESRLEGIESGADDYLVKPFSARELLARVKAHLGLARVRRDSVEVERRLRIDAELLASIVASSDDAIVSKDLNGVITSWNQGAERIFGYTAEEAIGQPVTLIIPHERRGEEARILAQLRQGERVDHFRTVRRRKDGTTLDVSLTISPVRDETGRVIGASKVARDITTENLVEQALRESEERFRAIVETTPECVKLVAPDGTLLHMNSSGLQMVGASSAEVVVGKSVYDLIAPEDRGRFRGFTERVCAGGKGSLEFDIVGLNGARRHMETHAAPMSNPDGSIVQLAVTRDVTERKRAEQKYRQLAEHLEAEVRIRTGELEKRNAEVLRQSDLLQAFSQRLLQAQDEERRRIARDLHDSSGQILAALGLTLAKMSEQARANGSDLVKDADDGQRLVQQLSQEIRTMSYLLHPPLLEEIGLPEALRWYIHGLMERSGLEITFTGSDDFGRLSREMELVLFRLVQECLTNIHRHSESKNAMIRMTREDGSVFLEVQDEGKGISAEKLAKIQAHGSGVGIRGMRERVRQFDGQMNIESDGKGTKVSFRFPISDDSSSQAESSIRPIQVSA